MECCSAVTRSRTSVSMPWISRYDIYSTAWKNGKPTEAAEDNVTITNDAWDSFGDDWFASIQPQLPGVDEEHVVLSDNTVDSASPCIQVKGSKLNNGLTITGNTGTKPARSTSGGSITKPYVGSTMTISHVDDVDIENNVFPVYDGTRELLSQPSLFGGVGRH